VETTTKLASYHLMFNSSHILWHLLREFSISWSASLYSTLSTHVEGGQFNS